MAAIRSLPHIHQKENIFKQLFLRSKSLWMGKHRLEKFMLNALVLTEGGWLGTRRVLFGALHRMVLCL